MGQNFFNGFTRLTRAMGFEIVKWLSLGAGRVEFAKVSARFDRALLTAPAGKPR